MMVETDALLGARDVAIGSRRDWSPPATAEPTAVAIAVADKQPAPRSVAVGGDRSSQLEAVRARHEAECPHCTTARYHRNVVFGEGNPNADIFFVGEAPGETEDLVGRPFVGPAGQKLDEMISAMGLRRDDVYIGNVLKSRPPDNRTPLPEEIAKCSPFLVEQILIVRPRVLVPLGGPAAKLLLGVETGITRLRGIWAQWHAPAGSGVDPIWVMPTFHPAYLLRNYTVETRKQVWSDLKAVIGRIAGS